ncbi:response regulator [Budvicia diplopodorum]|uniref:response regulator n=1 Tax=Budvicia diplopodorum TaxID=1119056 RepID=UPI001BAB12AD|nr:response regulator [Budvicia diplopodorum]
MTMYKVMLVEDDSRLASLIDEYLSDYEFDVSIVSRGDTALTRFGEIQPDIVILDLMLPGLDGMTVCRQLSAVSNVPIIIVTAREDSFDEVLGLEQGADDYVNKPVKPRILLARLRALLRRGRIDKPKINEEVTIGKLTISRRNRQVFWRGLPAELSNSEYKLLLALIESAGNVLSRDDLLKKMRGIEFDGLDRSIDNNISRLRRKLDDENAQKIKTVWGQGYLFIPSAWD